MTAYRRNLIPGGTYFFTVNLGDRRSSLLTDNIALLRWAFRYTRDRHSYTIDAIVILPDHLHSLWTLPAGDSDFATRWRLIKATFSRAIHPTEPVSPSRFLKRERGIWQRRFWERTIRDEGNFARHVDYIHFNPVKHGYVVQVQDWPFSSFHRMVRLGHYPQSWGAEPAVDQGTGSARGDGFRSALPILRASLHSADWILATAYHQFAGLSFFRHRRARPGDLAPAGQARG